MGTNRITIEQALKMDATQLAALTIEDLELLQEEITALKEAHKTANDFFNDHMFKRFGGIAAGMRMDEGKDSGTVRIDRDGLEIVCELPKKVEWQQDKLADIADKIRTTDEKVEDYMTIEYSVPEKKYTAWPQSIRDAFAPARTMKPGKPSFKIVAKKE